VLHPNPTEDNMKKKSEAISNSLDKNLNKLMKPIKNNNFKKVRPKRLKEED